MKSIAEFMYHFLAYDEVLPITVKGSRYKISKNIVERYQLIDDHSVILEDIILPKGVLEIDLQEDELEVIEKLAVDSLIGR